MYAAFVFLHRRQCVRDVRQRQVANYRGGSILQPRLLGHNEHGVPWVAKCVVDDPMLPMFRHVVQQTVERDRCRCPFLNRRFAWRFPHFIRVFRILRSIPRHSCVRHSQGWFFRYDLQPRVRPRVFTYGVANLSTLLRNLCFPSPVLRHVNGMANAYASVRCPPNFSVELFRRRAHLSSGRVLACVVMGNVRNAFLHIQVKGVVEYFMVSTCFHLCQSSLHGDGSTVFTNMRIGLFAKDVGVHANRDAFRVYTPA